MLRRPWLLNLILLAAIVAAGARLGAIWRSPPPQVGGGEAASAAAGRRGAPAPAAEVAAGAEGGGDYGVIAARDLFSAARGVVPPTPPAAAPEKPVAPAKAPPKVTLYGVVIVDGEKSAFLLEGAGDAKPRKVREGEAFAGGKLQTIRPDGVTLEFDGTEINVALRTPKEGVGAPLPAGMPGAAASPIQGRFPQAVRQPGAARRAVPVPATPRQAPRFTPGPRAPLARDDEDYEEDFEDEEFLDDEDYDEEYDEDFDEDLDDYDSEGY